ncbi:hypothetical protein INT46_006679 [Mucor plumbeus]|uniref:F-box domain-containing protein n=1 Tax=Mucor plumbeus TaxID=97098 RepID=A0A8H7QV57_9FUNG|nr:hypothetical protein INT46_006679 [Mucor plumbeus]
MSKTTIENLPTDILIQIVRYLDQKSQLELGLVSKCISYISIKQLWHTPRCTTITALEKWVHTLNKTHNAYPYRTWLIGLDLAFDNIQHVPDSILIPRQILLRSVKLHNVQATSSTFIELFCDEIEEIEFSNCSADIIIGFTTQMSDKKKKYLKLYKFSILDCYLTDALVNQIVSFTPKLRYFGSQGSGYMSDSAILAITENCPLIETLIVTLPKYIIQSNTITSVSLEALSKCLHLKKFICTGQVRIATEERGSWLLEKCTSLEHCDLSFS